MTLSVLNPATEETIAELEQAGVEQADEAVARAKAAFPAWRSVPPSGRARLLRRLATLVEEHGEELAQPRVRLDVDVMVAEDARCVLVLLVAHDLGQVLDEIAAAGDVEDLAATADSEYRHVALERRLE